MSGSEDCTLKIWNFVTGSEVRSLVAHSDIVTCVDISADSKFIASGSFDTTVKIWNSKTGQEIKSLIGHTDKVTSVAISPN